MSNWEISLPTHLSHAYVITGGSEESRRGYAQRLTLAYLCQGDNPPCGVCTHCRKVVGGIHPDVMYVTVPEGKREITVEQTRTLRGDAYIRPNEGARKVYVIDPADGMNQAAQNALLRVLEDGPEYAAFLLLTDSPGGLLSTIRSRCETVTLPPQGEESDPQREERAAQLARLLLTGSEFEVARGLTALELEKWKSAQLLELLAVVERHVASQLPQQPRRGVKVLTALSHIRGQSAYYPGPGHVLGWLEAQIFQ